MRGISRPLVLATLGALLTSVNALAAPTGSILINNGAVSTTSTAVTLNLSATDTGGGGIASMRFRSNTVDPYTAWEPYQTTRAWTLTGELGTKRVYVQFMDAAGGISDANPAAVGAQGYSDSIVLADATPPTGSILINNGAATTGTTAVTLNLSATDSGGSGLASMHFRNNTTEPYSAWEPYQATKAWTLTDGSGTKKVYVQFMDGAGNVSDANPAGAGAQAYSDSIVLADTTPPTGSILIENGAATTGTTAVTLYLSATDSGGSGLASMHFRNNTTDPYSAWEPYQATAPWTLADGLGTKKVYAQFMDGAGNISDANPAGAGSQGYSDSIVLDDLTPPEGSILIDNGALTTGTTAVTLDLSATDGGGSGLASMRFRNGTVDPYGAWEPYQQTRAWELTPELGTKEVYVQFMDGAGNISDADPVAPDLQGFVDSIVLDDGEWTVPGDLADCPACHGASPHPGKDGLSGTADDAPNVMTYWSGSIRRQQDGGHGDADMAAALACVDCHDISLPAAPNSAKHGTGTYNSILDNATRSTNTSHLKAEFFTEFPANSAGDWSIQVAFDNYCTWKCHDVNMNEVWDAGEPVVWMRHSKDVAPGGANEWSVQFGTHLTRSPGSADGIVDIPLDIDLNTDASGYFAPCVSCHDPHGTGVAKHSSNRSNFMMRFGFPPTSNVLCSKCHI